MSPVFIHANIIIASISIFSCCLFLHVLLWRIRHPRNHLGALLVVFFAPSAAFLFCALLFDLRLSGSDLLAIVLLHTSLSCAYIQIYPASQADSPSLKILVIVGGAMPEGMHEAEIQTHFNADELFAARVKDLLDAKLVFQNEGHLMLTPKGHAMVKPFLMLRALIGLSAGKG